MDVSAGRDSTWRRTTAADDEDGGDDGGGGMEVHVVPLELYDPARAKIEANLRWLFAKAYGTDHIPVDLRDPFYTDQYEQEHIKPPIIHMLLSGELYCHVYGLILHAEQAASLHSHQSLIQALSRRGIYVQENNTTPVSDLDLSSSPIKMSSHIHLIDALMMAYTAEMISAEKVMSSVKRFSNISASKEFPYDLEDSMTFWINKVNIKMRELTEKECKLKQHLLESPSHHKSPSKWYWKLVPPDLLHALAHCLLEPMEFSRVVRYRRDHLSGRTLQHFPLLDDLLKDVCDGAALLAVIHFYCPDVIKLEDICLKEVPSIAESVYNIQLLKEFSNEYLNKCFHLKPEDLLYSPPTLKNNVMVFIAELFWWFENVKPDFVQPRDLQEIKDEIRLNIMFKAFLQGCVRVFQSFMGNLQLLQLYSLRIFRELFVSSSLFNQLSQMNHEFFLPFPKIVTFKYCSSADLFITRPPLSSSFKHPLHNMQSWSVRLLLQPKSSRSYALTSNVTKRHYLPSSQSEDILTTNTSTELSIKTPSSSSSHSLLSLRQRQQRMAEEGTSELRNKSSPVPRTDGQHQDSILAWSERRARPLSQPAPYALHFAKEDESDSISIARSISKDSLASNIMSITPKHMLGSALPQHRLSGQSLLSHMCIEDEEEVIEEEELVSVIHPSTFSRHRVKSEMEPDELETHNLSSSSVGSTTYRILPHDSSPFALDHQADSYYLEPLIPAVPKRAKEKIITVNKQEESGEGRCGGAEAGRKATDNIPNTSKRKAPVVESNRSTSTPKPVDESPLSSGGIFKSEKTPSAGFFLHLLGEPDHHSSFTPPPEAGHDSDSDIADLEEDDDEDEQTDLAKEVVRTGRGDCSEKEYLPELGDGESDKLREDLKVTEKDDKEDASGRSSPCLSTVSWASSCSASGSAGVKMTSFAERKLLKLGLRDGYSSTSSSQKTTPDGSEFAPQWLGKESSVALEKNVMVCPSAVPSELLQLHMQLEEQRRAIEYQKKKMEALSARQRLKLGKAAFLNIVKKGEGKCDTLPLPPKHSLDSSGSAASRRKVKIQSCKDDSCLEALKDQTEGQPTNKDNRWNPLSQNKSSEPDVNECSHSIDLLNQAISTIQQQMMQLSLQQNLLMKQSVVSPQEPTQTVQSTTPNATQTTPSTSDSRSFAVHFVNISGSNSFPARRPPKLSSSQRSKAAEQKKSKENTKTAAAIIAFPDRQPSPKKGADGEHGTRRTVESCKTERSILRNATFRVHESPTEGGGNLSGKSKSQEPPVINTSESSAEEAEEEEKKASSSSKEIISVDESARIRGQLVEVDLSELKEPLDGSMDMRDSAAEVEQKNVLGFFFKDDEKAEDEMAKRRTAFLLKQQRKAEEARLRKQQQEAESELKRDETRRKAEEDRIRKEEEKARRELIKQEYLRRKQQALMEEQGLVKPRTRTKPRRNRPKSLHREESGSFSKGSTTRESLKVSTLIKGQSSAAGCRGADLSHRGSTLSLATDADSVISGGAESNRAASVCSMESFPVLSRTSSRNMERDWENGSIASSITSTEYNGPKLFKEPSSKSNKPIIINAIAHCCLAGKVNEVQKNVVLEELEKCESNHLIILFRDGGCQFRAIYSYSPETEEIIKFTGTGPRTIGRKMIDKLYKYNSDRKQFTVIPAKSVSVSVDALTIHNHLWQVKRPGSARRK